MKSVILSLSILICSCNCMKDSNENSNQQAKEDIESLTGPIKRQG